MMGGIVVRVEFTTVHQPIAVAILDRCFVQFISLLSHQSFLLHLFIILWSRSFFIFILFFRPPLLFSERTEEKD
jgi:hypothetical protein